MKIQWLSQSQLRPSIEHSMYKGVKGRQCYEEGAE